MESITKIYFIKADLFRVNTHKRGRKRQKRRKRQKGQKRKYNCVLASLREDLKLQRRKGGKEVPFRGFRGRIP